VSAHLFENLKPLSRKAVDHALDTQESGTIGCLALFFNQGNVEARYVDGPVQLVMDLWRSKQPPGAKDVTK